MSIRCSVPACFAALKNVPVEPPFKTIEVMSIFQLPNMLSLFMVFMLVPLTNVSCFHARAVFMSHLNVVTELFTCSIASVCVFSKSHIAFLLGACVVSQSQELQKAVSDTIPPVSVCKSEMSHCILVMLPFMLFTAVAIALF